MADETTVKRLHVAGSLRGGIPAPETAEVGQMLRVLEVDESGKITALEAVTSSVCVPVTQEEYNALVESGEYDPSTLYLIVGDEA